MKVKHSVRESVDQSTSGAEVDETSKGERKSGIKDSISIKTPKLRIRL